METGSPTQQLVKGSWVTSQHTSSFLLSLQHLLLPNCLKYVVLSKKKVRFVFVFTHMLSWKVCELIPITSLDIYVICSHTARYRLIYCKLCSANIFLKTQGKVNKAGKMHIYIYIDISHYYTGRNYVELTKNVGVLSNKLSDGSLT